MERTQQVLCIIYREVKGEKEFLLLHRIPSKGAFWQPVSGGVEEGEELLDAVYREIEEETSITKDNILLVTLKVHEFVIDKHYITNEPMLAITEYAFGVKVKPDVFISFEKNVYPEHDDFQWVTYEEALQLLKWDNNKDAFEKLQEYFTLEETKE